MFPNKPRPMSSPSAIFIKTLEPHSYKITPHNREISVSSVCCGEGTYLAQPCRILDLHDSQNQPVPGKCPCELFLSEIEGQNTRAGLDVARYTDIWSRYSIHVTPVTEQPPNLHDVHRGKRSTKSPRVNGESSTMDLGKLDLRREKQRGVNDIAFSLRRTCFQVFRIL